MAPPFLANWLAFKSGEPRRALYEYALYSDAWYVGEITDELGPYQVLNQLRLRPGVVVSALTVRAALHHDFGATTRSWPEKSESAHFTGGDFASDLAALLSLQSGGRLASRGPVRTWDDESDPLGRPSGYQGAAPAVDLSAPLRMLPWSRGQKSICPADLLSGTVFLKPKHAVSLVRAARSYANALWVGEGEPELAWLLLVSALETGAGSFFKEKSLEVDLRNAHPELAERLDLEHPGATSIVAEHLGGKSEATSKFIQFLTRFAPPPPDARPPQACRYEPWTHEGLTDLARSVYRMRSKVLHSGVPIPEALCMPPHFLALKDPPYERPITQYHPMKLGGVSHSDAFVHLHVFEYIARQVLLGWWKHLVEAARPAT